MADDTAFSVFVDENNIENFVTCIGKTEAITRENHMAMILATILMKLVTVTLELMKISQKSVFCLFYVIIVLWFYNFVVKDVKGKEKD